MDNLTYILYICIAVPLLFMLLLVHRKSKLPIGFLLCGITICVVAAELNSILLAAFDNDYYYVTTSITPLTEELLKSLPIVLFAFEFTDSRERIIAAAFSVGVGFSIMENMIILVGSVDSITVTWALIRGFASSLIHSICTVTLGIGVGIIVKEHKKKLFLPVYLSMLILAVTFHSIFNIYIQTGHTFVAVIQPLIGYIIISAFLIHRRRKKKLEPETQTTPQTTQTT